VDALADKNASVRRRATVVLGEMQHGNPAVNGLLRSAAQDVREIVREQVSELLGKADVPKAAA